MIEHPRLRELAMKRHVGGLISFSLLTLIAGGCQPDAPIGVPVLAARVEPKPPNVLRDAIAFFTREFSASGGVAIMQPNGSGRQPLAGAEAGFEPAISPNGRRIAFSRNTDIGVSAIYIMDLDEGVATPSSRSMMYMAVTPMSVFLENAIRRPFGEIAGSNPASAPASGCLPEPFGCMIATPPEALNSRVKNAMASRSTFGGFGSTLAARTGTPIGASGWQPPAMRVNNEKEMRPPT